MDDQVRSQAPEEASPKKMDVQDVMQLEDVPIEKNLVYEDDEQEPELHGRTYLALIAILVQAFVTLMAVQAPPAALTYIGESLHGTASESWVPNALSLTQTVLGPVISSASDVFQIRKSILVVSCLISTIGCAIAPGSTSISRLVIAQTLIGVGFATAPLNYCVVSEILPRKWRPMAQAAVNLVCNLGAITGILSMGAWTRSDNLHGWKNFYWLQMSLWAASTICLLVGYRPPKRHTRLDHLSFWQKLNCLDLPGFFLLSVGLALFVASLSLGGTLYSWISSRVLSTLILGIFFLILFGLYEWKATKRGIIHHELFQPGKAKGRTFSICLGLMFIEGILGFAFTIFYPLMALLLFESDPFLLTVRLLPYWISSAGFTLVWGSLSVRYRTIREPLFLGFLILTGAIIGWSAIQPDESLSALVFAGLAGIGFGSPLVLIIAGVQLSTPHNLMATATALTTSCRALAGTIMTAIGYAAYGDRVNILLPKKVGSAALEAGLSAKYLGQFIAALSGNDREALSNIPGVTPAIIAAGVAALKQAFADSIRLIYIIAAPFGVLAMVMCFFLGDLRKTMNYHVDAPVEELHAKNQDKPSHTT